MPPVQDLWHTVTKSFQPLAAVLYGLRVHGWQGSPWHVRRVELVEALNEPYRLILELVVDEQRLDLDDLLGDACTLDIDRRTATVRAVHGVVLAAHDLGRVAGRHHVRLEVGPALALLGQQVDTRAWQDLSALDILRLVLEGPLAAHGRELRLDGLLAADYPKREYCVQFRESDLAFAARLMEEEGITYFFDHASDAAERLVLVDDNGDFAAVQADPIEIVDTEPDTARAESIQRFVFGRRLRSTAVAQRNFDWQSPEAPLAAARPGQDLRGRTREIYEHDDVVYPGDGARHAKIKQERLAVGGHAASGTSNATVLTPGTWFTLSGHRSDLDEKYLVTRVIHRGECPDVAILDGVVAQSAPRYTNEFECIPLTVPFRPSLSQPRPRVSGLQTAIVTGPPGEEVHCDEHGRIKVLPHWDRVSPRDETSSFWIRVAQSVAGGSWGMFALPRIGMEVVVDFLDGDPDRPLVVGCVYNGQNGPPYPLPAEKTKTTLKSNSSPGGGGSNELRFEDQAGAEEVYLHAQKDWNTVVGADNSLSVGGSETNSISANRTTSVGANDKTSVGANATLDVGANLTESAGANHTASAAANQSLSAGVNQSLTAGANQSLSAGADQSISVTGNRTVDVGVNEKYTVGGKLDHTVTGTFKQILSADADISTGAIKKETTGGDYNLTIGGQHKVEIATNGTVTAVEYKIEAGTKVTLTGAGSTIVLEGGKVTIKDASLIEIKGDGQVKIDGGGVVNVDGGGAVNINGGGDVKIDGSGSVTILGGTVDVDAGNVNVNASAAVSINGGGTVSLCGATVRINC